MRSDKGGQPFLRVRHTPFQFCEGTEKQSGNLTENAHLLKLCQPGGDHRLTAAKTFQQQELSPHIRPELRSGKLQQAAQIAACDNAFYSALLDKMKIGNC